LALRVGVAKWPTQERREPETEDRAEVTFAWRSEYALVQAAGSLVDEGEREALGDVA